MNIFLRVILCIYILLVSCTDPNLIGLEVQPPSDVIFITESSDFMEFDITTESEDSIRTDNVVFLVLGSINNDFSFPASSSSFYSQILLEENNTDLGTNPIVDSVVMSYMCGDEDDSKKTHYGDLEEFSDIQVFELAETLYEDSNYYSNSVISIF